AEHRAQGGLCQLAGGFQITLNLDDCLVRFDHPEIQNRTDLHRNVVSGDHVLTGNVHGDCAQIHLHHLLQDWNHENQHRPLHTTEAAKGEHHAALILPQDAQCVCSNDHDDHQQHGKADIELIKHGYFSTT